MSVVTHLWQSTLCVGIAALLAIALRHAPARVRQWIWLCASVKFLVPLSPLVALGAYVGAWTSPMVAPTVSIAVRWLDASLSPWSLDAAAAWTTPGFWPGTGESAIVALLLVWLSGVIGLTVWRWTQWRWVSRLARAATPLQHGRERAALARLRRTSARQQPIELRLCGAYVEPGVLGIFHPTLLWPDGLSARLSDAELDAIMAHEVCHVARRDNLSALIQMVVEITFWFHPVVWWVGARLVSERERACDEEVLQMGTDERRYAEAIVKVCGFSLRSPAVFVASAGASDLSRRIERILRRRPAAPLTMWTRLLLGSVLFVTAGAPLGTGVLNAHREIAPSSSPAPLGPDASMHVATQDERTVHRPGEGVTLPKPVDEIKPSYTAAAMRAQIQGRVVLEAVVLASGAVGDVKVVRSLDAVHGLDDESVKALKQWRFEPGTKDKKPVAVLVEVEMRFTLKRMP